MSERRARITNQAVVLPRATGFEDPFRGVSVPAAHLATAASPRAGDGRHRTAGRPPAVVQHPGSSSCSHTHKENHG